MTDDERIQPDWDAIFKKSDHTFSEYEIECAGLDDMAPLSQFLPKFWEKYKYLGKNPANLEQIWNLEFEWFNMVKQNQFQLAKNLYRKLKKCRL